VTVFSDRGYWTPNLVYWLVACGAFVVGTLIHAMCWPITYCQEKKDSDKRTFLEPKGAPTLFLKRLQNSKTRNQLLTIGAFRSGTENISLALSSKHHENQWDCILMDPRDLSLYETGELKKKQFLKVNNIKALPEATEYHIQQILVNMLTKVNPITLTQGTVDWKYARRFSFTSASSYDIINLCLTKLWHLYENNPHWQALKAYLDGAYPFVGNSEQEDSEGIQEVLTEQDIGDENGMEHNSAPRTIQEQVAHDVAQLNSGALTPNDL
jgi:hypothetical protein